MFINRVVPILLAIFSAIIFCMTAYSLELDGYGSNYSYIFLMNATSGLLFLFCSFWICKFLHPFTPDYTKVLIGITLMLCLVSIGYKFTPLLADSKDGEHQSIEDLNSFMNNTSIQASAMIEAGLYQEFESEYLQGEKEMMSSNEKKYTVKFVARKKLQNSLAISKGFGYASMHREAQNGGIFPNKITHPREELKTPARNIEIVNSTDDGLSLKSEHILPLDLKESLEMQVSIQAKEDTCFQEDLFINEEFLLGSETFCIQAGDDYTIHKTVYNDSGKTFSQQNEIYSVELKVKVNNNSSPKISNWGFSDTSINFVTPSNGYKYFCMEVSPKEMPDHKFVLENNSGEKRAKEGLCSTE